MIGQNINMLQLSPCYCALHFPIVPCHGRHHEKVGGGHIKKMRFVPEFVPPTFEMLPAPLFFGIFFWVIWQRQFLNLTTISSGKSMYVTDRRTDGGRTVINASTLRKDVINWM